VLAFGFLQQESIRDAVQDRVRCSGEVTALKPRIVLDTHARQQGGLGTAQPWDAPVRAGRQSHLMRLHLRPPRREEFTNFISVLCGHETTLGVVRAAWGSLAVHPTARTPPGFDESDGGSRRRD